jgi:hypothetical protein
VKKITLTLVLSTVIMAFVAMLSCSYANAASKIIAKPSIKTVIEGKTASYKDVPIIYQNRTFLPLRAISVNLGVANDSKHIIWNGAKKSVTIIKGSTQIVLKIGVKTATVNNKSTALDVAPVIYKNKTYIPVRFVATAFGEKVIWVGSQNMVVIRDEARFEQVKQAIIKSVTAETSQDKYKASLSMSMTANIEDMPINAKVDADIISDGGHKTNQINGTVSMNGLNGLLNIPNTKIEAYSDGSTLYLKDPSKNQWMKLALTGSGIDATAGDITAIDPSQLNTALVLMISSSDSDELLAGLFTQYTSDQNEVLVKGDMYLYDFLHQKGLDVASVVDTSGIKFDKLNVEFSVNKTTNLLNKVSFTMNIVSSAVGSKGNIALNLAVTYSDYNGNFDVIIPDDVKNNAVEVKNITDLFSGIPALQ